MGPSPVAGRMHAVTGTSARHCREGGDLYSDHGFWSLRSPVGFRSSTGSSRVAKSKPRWGSASL